MEIVYASQDADITQIGNAIPSVRIPKCGPQLDVFAEMQRMYVSMGNVQPALLTPDLE